MPHDIHHYERSLERTLSRVKNNPQLNPKNKKEILEYVRFRAACSLSLPRQVRYLETLPKFSRLVGETNFDDLTKQDMINAIGLLEKEATQYETKRTEKECFKCFFRWLKNGDKENDEDRHSYPKEVSWISASRKRNQSILPDDILTEDEIRRMAEAAQNSRDRAITLFDYETGGRVGETLPACIGDVEFDKYGAVIHVTGKTGGRRIRIVYSAGALSEWLNQHPAKDDRNAPLWTSYDKGGKIQRLEYPALAKMLRTLARRCSPPVKKRVTPKMFRHARATNLANVLTEAQMKEFFGWTKESRMPSVYVHLSGRNLDNAILKINGMKSTDEIEQEERPLKPRHCMRCKEINPPINRFCFKCGAPLDVKTAVKFQEKQEETDEIMDRLFDNPMFQEAVREALAKQEIALSVVGK